MLRKVFASRRAFHTSPKATAKILASDAIEKICGERFKARGHELVEMPGIKKDELIKIIGEYEGLVVRSGTKVTPEIIEAGHKLKLIGRAGTGVDNINVRAATSKGILVVNTPGGNTISTGELALAHILSLARNIPQATAALKADIKNFKSARNQYTGTELSGKTLGINTLISLFIPDTCSHTTIIFTLFADRYHWRWSHWSRGRKMVPWIWHDDNWLRSYPFRKFGAKLWY